MLKLKSLVLSLAVAASLMLAACSQPHKPDIHEDTSFVTDEASFIGSKTISPKELEVLAELELSNGNVIRFIDEQFETGQPQVGVVELIQAEQSSVLSSLTNDGELSPLEIFLALADTQAPEKLMTHHRSLASNSDAIPHEPRSVAIGLETQATDFTSCAYMLPTGYHAKFLTRVADAFGAALPHHGHGHNLTSTHYGVTGKSAKRALGTCNASGYVKTVNVSYQWSSKIWVNVPLGVAGLFPGQSLFYYSNSGFLLHQRYRIKVGYTANGLAFNYAHTEGSW